MKGRGGARWREERKGEREGEGGSLKKTWVELEYGLEGVAGRQARRDRGTLHSRKRVCYFKSTKGFTKVLTGEQVNALYATPLHFYPSPSPSFLSFATCLPSLYPPPLSPSHRPPPTMYLFLNSRRTVMPRRTKAQNDKFQVHVQCDHEKEGKAYFASFAN